MERSVAGAVTLIAAQLLASWALVLAIGGADRAPPHWFYVPVVFAGLRFGAKGLIPAGVAAGLLAGPAAPADVAAGIPQDTDQWVLRMVFFVLVGLAMHGLLRHSRSTVRADRLHVARQSALDGALRNGQLILYYQPVVSVDDRTIIGVEALVRWLHPDKGVLLPDQFLRDVEHLELLDSWVLRQACAQMVDWRAGVLGTRPFWCAVNVSANTLAQGRFADRVSEVIATAGIRPADICLEISEHAVIDQFDSAADRLNQLRDLGVRIAIDDFGTGHASFLYLRHLPLDFIKVDGSLVRGATTPRRDRAVMIALTGLAATLEAVCIAEGVETAAHLEKARRGFCKLAQGYLLARPAPADEVSPLLAAGSVRPWT